MTFAPMSMDMPNILFCFQGDAGHGFHRLNRIFAGGGFAGKHDGAGAVVNGVGHVGNFRPGGADVVDHGFQHFRGGNHALAQHAGLGDHVLLNGGQFFVGDFYPQIAPGHHYAVAMGADFLQMIHTGAVFDFGDEIDAGYVVGG